MFVHMILVHMVEMTIVKIIHMAIVANRRVPAVRAMAMGVVRMVLLSASVHRYAPSQRVVLPWARDIVAKGKDTKGAHG